MRGVLSSRGSASGTGPGPMDHGYNRCDGRGVRCDMVR